MVEIVELTGPDAGSVTKHGAAVEREIQEEIARLKAEVKAQRDRALAREQEDFYADPENRRGIRITEKDVPVYAKVVHTTLQYRNGDSYSGEVLAGIYRHGKGTHVCAKGDKYEGSWHYDRRHGRGRMEFARGLIYDGDWADDQAQGHAMCQYENGTVYKGEFASDVRCGWGRATMPDGSWYEGEWDRDRMHGQGALTHADGSYFEGTFREGQRVQGRFVHAGQGAEYVGEFAQGDREGHGAMTVEGQWRYVGEWRGGLRHGRGTCMYADGATYEGMWAEDVRCGEGVLVEPRGLKYEGTFADDVPHGQGCMVLPTGDKYRGQVQRGLPHGRGQGVGADGEAYDGEWVGGQREGRGTCRYASGDVYEGEWAGGKRHGRGVCRFADGVTFRGLWEGDLWVQAGADAERSEAEGAGLGRAVAGETAAFRVQARDPEGNPRLTGGDAVEATLLGPGGVRESVTVADSGDGSYACTYLVRRAGSWQLRVEVSGEEMAGSPFTVRVAPGAPCVKKSVLVGEGRRSAHVGVPTRVFLEMRDGFGNACGPDHFCDLAAVSAELVSHADLVTAEAALESEGRVSLTYALPCPGMYRLTVAVGGVVVPGCPYSVSGQLPGVVGDEAREGAGESESVGQGSEGQGASEAVAVAVGDGKGEGQAAAGVEDVAGRWARIAEAEFARDGDARGWESEEEGERLTAQERYARDHPGVPVVENLEDMWMLTKYQNEVKAREEAQARARQEARQRRRQGIRATLAAKYAGGAGA